MDLTRRIGGVGNGRVRAFSFTAKTQQQGHVDASHHKNVTVTHQHFRGAIGADAFTAEQIGKITSPLSPLACAIRFSRVCSLLRCGDNISPS